MSLLSDVARPARRRFEVAPQLGLFIIVLVLCAIFYWRQPGFLSSFNLFNLGREVARDIVIGFAQMVVLATGGMNLAVGSIGVQMILCIC